MGRFTEAAAGALTGSTEVCIMQPIQFFKTELQQNRFTLTRALQPKYLYRGTLIASTTIAPVVAIQFSVNGACLSAFPALTETQRKKNTYFSGITAGVVSAVIQSPSQLIEVNQQKHGGTIQSIFLRIYRTHGLKTMYRGFSMTATREGFFSMSYLANAPLVTHHIQTSTSCNSNAATLLGSIIAGSMAAIVTHPADTLKTKIQGDLFPVKGAIKNGLTNMNVHTTISNMNLMNNGSKIKTLKHLYCGFLPRWIRIVSCTFIYGQLNPFYTDMIENASME